MTTHLVLGGTRSGKSVHAERLAAATASAVAYVATGGAVDAEMSERVAVHRRRRPDTWRTFETTDLHGVLAEQDLSTTVLVDDLEGWLVDRMTAHDLWTDDTVAPWGSHGQRAADAIVDDAARWWRHAAARSGATVVVAGQPGFGIVPMGAATRRYVDLHGRLVQVLADAADEVTLVVAGRAVPLPPVARAVPPPSLGVVAPGDAPDPAVDLRDHGDTQVPTGTVDLAVNVVDGPPPWLVDHLAERLGELAAYPDATAARLAVAHRHGRSPDEVVVLDGAAEAFWLLPNVLRPRHAVCVHPGFTEAEAALRAAGVRVSRVARRSAGWHLDVREVPDDADLVVLGRPDNPTGVVDPAPTIAALCRPGRTVVVDEAFADLLPDATGLSDRSELPGLVVLRSLTKVWGIAGLRVGYLLAAPALAARLDAARQPWSVNHLALEALRVLSEREDERRARADQVAADRAHLVRRLRELDDVEVTEGHANFVLLRTGVPDLRERLLAEGFAVRRGETFPGLDRHHVRIAVRAPEVSDALVAALARVLATPAPPDPPPRSCEVHP